MSIDIGYFELRPQPLLFPVRGPSTITSSRTGFDVDTRVAVNHSFGLINDNAGKNIGMSDPRLRHCSACAGKNGRPSYAAIRMSKKPWLATE